MAVSEIHFRAMASDAHVIVVDGPPESCAIAKRRIEQLESRWSRFIEGSDINRLNHAGGRPIQVDPATVTLIEAMAAGWTATDCRYDPTLLPSLLEAGYVASIDDPGTRTRLPRSVRPAPARTLSVEQVEFGPDQFVTLPAGLAIDAGGIGKGLAADLVCAELLARGATGALSSIGGDLAAVGVAPEVEGWRVDIEDPLNSSVPVTQVMVSGGGIATSSTRTRRWIKNNTEHHHTIDPGTAQPSQTDLVAATVIAPCGWNAEVHATALLLGGTADFDNYAARKQLEAVAITAAGTALTTAAFAHILPEAVSA